MASLAPTQPFSTKSFATTTKLARMPGDPTTKRTPAEEEEERKRNLTKGKNKQNPASTYNNPGASFLTAGNLASLAPGMKY